jgi:hypothetical protein
MDLREALLQAVNHPHPPRWIAENIQDTEQRDRVRLLYVLTERYVRAGNVEGPLHEEILAEARQGLGVNCQPFPVSKSSRSWGGAAWAWSTGHGT